MRVPEVLFRYSMRRINIQQFFATGKSGATADDSYQE
jgi:hypothetical protein